MPLILRSRSILGMLDDTMKTARETAKRLAIGDAEDTLSDKTDVMRAAIAIALYSCSKNRDIADPARPRAELARHQGAGRSYLPRRIELGYRVGAALRLAQARRQQTTRGVGVTRARPAPYVKGAH